MTRRSSRREVGQKDHEDAERFIAFFLEVIEIDHEEAELGAEPAAALELLGGALEEAAPVAHSGELVGGGQLLEQARLLLELGVGPGELEGLLVEPLRGGLEGPVEERVQYGLVASS